MPANLTMQYRRAEAAFRRAATPREELECLQHMLRELPKHKGTDKLQADLKARIAKAKLDLQRPVAAKSTSKITKQGAGQVLLVGAPNSGKSQLLNALTGARADVAPYPFTTRDPTPGMMRFEDCPIQLIDLPPITAEYLEANVVEWVRGADLVLLVVDLDSDQLIEDTLAVVNQFQHSKTRLAVQTRLDEDDIGVSLTKTLLVMNKCDARDADERMAFFNEHTDLPFGQLPVSACESSGLDTLRKSVFDALDIVRVYTKHPRQKEPDMDKPLIVRAGDTLAAVAAQVHRDVANRLTAARVWGARVQPGTNVKPDYQPCDGDVVELHTGS